MRACLRTRQLKVLIFVIMSSRFPPVTPELHASSHISLSPQLTFFPSTSILIPCNAEFVVLAGKKGCGCLLKNGHGGSTIKNVRAVPPNPMYSVW